jgi:hypothetical protein
MKSPWKNPKTDKPEIARFYWVYCYHGKIVKARVIDGKWFDSNYSVVKNVVLYADDVPPLMPSPREIEFLLSNYG